MDELDEFMEKLRKTRKLVIVEGKKDRAALESIGVRKIIELNKRPLYEVVEEVANAGRQAVILTDLDRTGKLLFGKLNSALSQHGVEVDNYFREFLFRHTKLTQIEGLPAYLEHK